MSAFALLAAGVVCSLAMLLVGLFSPHRKGDRYYGMTLNEYRRIQGKPSIGSEGD